MTAIIIFRNEKEEIEKTICSALTFAREKVNFILVDDCSDDKFDYKNIAVKYNAIYIRNNERLGSAPSRDIGVKNCKDEYFIQLDGHMRFYTEGWDILFTDYLKNNPNSIVCGRMVAIDYNKTLKHENENGENRGNYAGATFGKNEKFFEDIKWLAFDKVDNGNRFIQIPCVLGANYSTTKSFYEYVDGLHGLIGYGFEEQFLSAKAWMCGGKCVLATDIFIGHLFGRPKKQYVKYWEMGTNAFICYELLAKDTDIYKFYCNYHGKEYLEEFSRRAASSPLETLRARLNNKATKSFESFQKYCDMFYEKRWEKNTDECK